MIEFHNKLKLIIVGISLTLASCATNQGSIKTVTYKGEAGSAVKAALAKQIVDPNPAKGAPKSHPAKGAAALDRYINDEVKEPIDVQELEISTGN